MDKHEALNRIYELGLLAVIRGPSPEITVKMVDALVRGGVRGIEITYSTPNATDVVRLLDEKFGHQIILGMGTLTKPEQANEARMAGARFLVSPHLDEKLALAMVDTGLAVMIGALTPSEIVAAYHSGSDVVKLFPGSQGGPSYLRALRGPFPEIPIMPTGGVSIDNIQDWFDAGAFAVGAGSNLCPPSWAREGRFEEIIANAEKFLDTVLKARAPN